MVSMANPGHVLTMMPKMAVPSSW